MPFVPVDLVPDLPSAHDLLQKRYLNAYQAGNPYHFAICLKGIEEPIGYMETDGPEEYEIGYGLMKDYRGRGIATEAAVGLLQRLKEDGVPFAAAAHDVMNPASGRVMQKAGMSYRYSYREFWEHNKTWVIFRLYQTDLNGKNETRRTLWDRFPEHFVEELS